MKLYKRLLIASSEDDTPPLDYGELIVDEHGIQWMGTDGAVFLRAQWEQFILQMCQAEPDLIQFCNPKLVTDAAMPS
jgi:hypothetical protein